MPLELGLGRITRLLANAQPFPWRAIHVAGTNGKGSVCSHASNLLRLSGVTTGQFSTPHLRDRWDTISLHGLPIAKHRYDSIMGSFKDLDRRENINATEFELLTATAFRAFTDFNVDVGVVEVGLGGRLDATNVLESPLATVITKIGMDHQAWLGDTLEKIAAEKAAIMKPGAPCFVDATNPPALHDLFRAHAERVGAGLVTFVDPDEAEYETLFTRQKPGVVKLPHQRANMALAYAACRAAWRALGHTAQEVHRLGSVTGRLHSTSIQELTGRLAPVLLDGAHNPQAAAVLADFVDATYRQSEEPPPVTWLLAVSEGKDAKQMLGHLLREGDNVVAAEFGPVDEMPWVHPTPAGKLLADAEAVARIDVGVAPGRCGGLEAATRVAEEGPLVIAGSLYLVSEVLRDQRAGTIDPSRALPPGQADFPGWKRTYIPYPAILSFRPHEG